MLRTAAAKPQSYQSCKYEREIISKRRIAALAIPVGLVVLNAGCSGKIPSVDFPACSEDPQPKLVSISLSEKGIIVGDFEIKQSRHPGKFDSHAINPTDTEPQLIENGILFKDKKTEGIIFITDDTIIDINARCKQE